MGARSPRWRVGTSGYSYKGWRGHFYPADLKPADMLAYYAGRLPAVEINNTFYRMPRKSMLEAWAAKVPDGFRFVLKAPRRISHFKRLKGTEEETRYLLEAAGALGDRLGALLFQLPPGFPVDLDRLRGFLELLPEGTRAAFEFRHRSWEDDAVHEALRASKAALVLSDTGEGDPGSIPCTADWGYLRLRRDDYPETDLAAWAGGIAAQGWGEAFVFFKHEEEGAGPRMAARFLELAGGGA